MKDEDTIKKETISRQFISGLTNKERCLLDIAILSYYSKNHTETLESTDPETYAKAYIAIRMLVSNGLLRCCMGDTPDEETYKTTSRGMLLLRSAGYA